MTADGAVWLLAEKGARTDKHDTRHHLGAHLAAERVRNDAAFEQLSIAGAWLEGGPERRRVGLCYSARAFGPACELCYSARAFGPACELCYSARAVGPACGLCYSARAFGPACELDRSEQFAFCKESDVGTTVGDGPSEEPPSELCVARFVVCNSREHRADRRVARVLERLGRFDGGDRLADAPFADSGRHDIAKRARVEGTLDRKQRWTDFLACVGARDGKGKLGVERLVPHGCMGTFNQLGRSSETHQLQREPRECRDGGMLHEGDARPRLGETGAALGAQVGHSRVHASFAPVAPTARRHAPSGRLARTRTTDDAKRTLAHALTRLDGALLAERTIAVAATLIAVRLTGECGRGAARIQRVGSAREERTAIGIRLARRIHAGADRVTAQTDSPGRALFIAHASIGAGWPAQRAARERSVAAIAVGRGGAVGIARATVEAPVGNAAVEYRSRARNERGTRCLLGTMQVAALTFHVTARLVHDGRGIEARKRIAGPAGRSAQ